ncbi:MAG: winged helix-turn-helix domain-containing protein [Erythrobacter sp.]
MKQVRIGNAQVDFDSLIIEGDAGSYSVEPKVLGVLEALIANHGGVVSREELIDKVWGVGFGGDERLSRAISLLRKALGDRRGEYQHIETIPKRGYRLIAPIDDLVEGAGSYPPSKIAAPPLSMAVLPFANLSADPGQEHLADGMTEELLNALSKLPGLQVTGRTSSFAFKGQNTDIREVAQALNVAHIIDGSVRCDHGKLRITAQLIKAEDGFQLWSETFDENLEGIFDLQERIAQSILTELSRFIDIEVPPNVSQHLTRNPKAYAAFVQGRELYHKRNGQQTLPTAISHLEKAVELDPEFADAWAALAMAHFVLPEYSKTARWAYHMTASREALSKVEQLDNSNSLAKLTKAYIFEHDLRFDEAAMISEQALKEHPGDAETEVHFAFTLMAIGLHEQAEQLIRNTMPQNPLSPIYPVLLGGIMRALGDVERAIGYYQQAFNLGHGAAGIAVATLKMQTEQSGESVEFIKKYFGGLDAIDQATLASPITRHLVFGAFFRKKRGYRWIVKKMLESRFSDPQRQATTTSIGGFLLVDDPTLWMKNVLEKPNPYVAYSLSRIWDPVQECANVRQHKDFPAFAEQIGLVRAWQRYGWPPLVQPNPGTDGSNLKFLVVE